MPDPRSISRRVLLEGAAALSAVLAARGLPACAASTTAAPAKKWNIVMLVSDEHNRKIMGCAGHGSVQTPNLDRLAKAGVRLTDAYATSPLCAPSRVSLLTGLAPQQHGVYGNQHVLDERVPTFAAHFRKHGYLTAVIGKTHTNNPGATYGFDYWLGKDSEAFQMEAATRKDTTHPLPVPAADKALFDGIHDHRLRGAPIEADATLVSGVVMDAVESWLKQPKTQPFFLYASWTEPHHPWFLPKAYYNLYDPARVALPPWIANDLSDAPYAARLAQQAGWDEMTEAQHRLCLARYTGSISYTDFVAGKIIDMVDKLGFGQNTLVVYLSDHGDMASEKKMWLKSVMYDAASGIPVILRMPGVLSPGTTSDVLFSGMDLYPTLAGLVGIAADLPTNLAGKDHSAQVRGVRTGEPTFVYSGLGTPTELGLPAQLMIRDRHFKFIRYRGAKDTGGSEIRELYNMDADPWETTNLAGKNNVATMEDELMSTGDGFVHRLGSCPYPIRKVQDLPRGGSSEDPNADIED